MVVGTNAALVDYFWSNFPYTAQKPVLLYWITSTPDVVNGKWTKSLTVGSHSHTHTRTHTPMGSYCRARCCQAHWEQFRVQTLTQDTEMWTGTIQNTNFGVIGNSFYQPNRLTVEAILVQISQWCNGAPVSTIHLVSSQVGWKELQVQWAALQVNVDPAHFFQTVVRAADHEHRSSNQQIGHPAARNSHLNWDTCVFVNSRLQKFHLFSARRERANRIRKERRDGGPNRLLLTHRYWYLLLPQHSQSMIPSVYKSKCNKWITLADGDINCCNCTVKNCGPALRYAEKKLTYERNEGSKCFTCLAVQCCFSSRSVVLKNIIYKHCQWKNAAIVEALWTAKMKAILIWASIYSAESIICLS